MRKEGSLGIPGESYFLAVDETGKLSEAHYDVFFGADEDRTLKGPPSYYMDRGLDWGLGEKFWTSDRGGCPVFPPTTLSYHSPVDKKSLKTKKLHFVLYSE